MSTYCPTWSQVTKGKNTGGGEFDPVCELDFGVAQCKVVDFKIKERSPDIRRNAEDLLRETVKSPLDALRTFFSTELLELIVMETNRYVAQHLMHNLNASREEILTLIGILLLSGYHKLPSRRLYCRSELDVHVPIVSEFMRRNRYDELLRFLHLTNNDGLDGLDSLYKVRQLFHILNASFKQVSPGK
ncbi:hypothetical protein ANN_15505 [Periplaneta americana]|uniref:PiggyBac transposable element-derived protein domain-containing protein n=1 Tax=Periplaneta americana TaxID=6978 RepID=A0ABQ8SHF1_PERAM|nr:hypothetical protein ANN_15505 [Periplaneta americana]